jgi:hypothetical protein
MEEKRRIEQSESNRLVMSASISRKLIMRAVFPPRSGGVDVDETLLRRLQSNMRPSYSRPTQASSEPKPPGVFRVSEMEHPGDDRPDSYVGSSRPALVMSRGHWGSTRGNDSLMLGLRNQPVEEAAIIQRVDP